MAQSEWRREVNGSAKWQQQTTRSDGSLKDVMPPSKLKAKAEKQDETSIPTQWPAPALHDTDLRMSYVIARGEQGVLTFQPYKKGILLPHWRFKTVPIAEHSSTTLRSAFDNYVKAGDFVGADMARKFIQMGMTRAKRYANHKGGRKYDRTEREIERDGGSRKELPKSTGHEGMEVKLAASEVFKEVWKVCTSDTRYIQLKEEWQKEKKDYDKLNKGKKNSIKKVEVVDHLEVKTEVEEEDSPDD
ncbi:hypothetical protein DOTSEDRAFT_82281 [Dothistroma septosporum NZE10]|uniref:Uncharacterized protein n=1 Tax=Dothistroma septosporum (strain NZE10 / CBS 128990) TaxID=675120 RepID=N1PGR9_DOTSN|nr:hypothetical protein DOTSEDRAFT_82281 [Dothistroma septosporum NZE10]